MIDESSTRRAFLAAAGSTLSLAGCLGGSDGGDSANATATATPDEALTPEKTELGSSTPVDDAHVGDQPTGAWHAVASPVSGTLYDVEVARHNVYAVGENGVILTRCNGIWEVVQRPDNGVTGSSLYDAAVTSDGRVLWFAGSSGALGAYEPESQTLMGYSPPDGHTSTWEAIGVTGAAGEETVFLADGSGNLVRGDRSGKEINWHDPRGLGDGSAFSAMQFVDDVGHLTDTGGTVYRSKDGGDSWTKVGIRGTSAALLDIGAADGDTLFVSAGSGAVYRHNGMTWTELDAGSADVTGLSVESRTDGLACTSGGEVYTLADGRWKQLGRPVDGGLQSVVHGTATTPQVAVGSGGAIVERFPSQDDDS